MSPKMCSNKYLKKCPKFVYKSQNRADLFNESNFLSNLYSNKKMTRRFLLNLHELRGTVRLMLISKLCAWNKSFGLLALIELIGTAVDGANKSSNKADESLFCWISFISTRNINNWIAYSITLFLIAAVSCFGFWSAFCLLSNAEAAFWSELNTVFFFSAFSKQFYN